MKIALFFGLVFNFYLLFNVYESSEKHPYFFSQLLAEEKLVPTVKQDELKLSIRAGRGKAQLCTRCHGRLGMLKAVKIAQFKGTVEGFVIKELIDFRQGVRSHAVMNSIAQTLSDKDINDIAAWYNAISIKP